MKTCTKCKVSLPLSAFHKDRAKRDGLYSRCKACHKTASMEYRNQPGVRERKAQVAKRWYATHKDQHASAVKQGHLRRKYGLTVEGYEDLLIQQDGCCAICQDPESLARAMAVDHDHKTGQIRGLLCFDCNIVLGKMKDNPALLRRAAEYLESPSKS